MNYSPTVPTIERVSQLYQQLKLAPSEPTDKLFPYCGTHKKTMPQLYVQQANKLFPHLNQQRTTTTQLFQEINDTLTVPGVNQYPQLFRDINGTPTVPGDNQYPQLFQEI